MSNDPIFQPGDIVQLNAVGQAKAQFPHRRGVVVGISKSGLKVKVHWSALIRSEFVHRTFLEFADGPMEKEAGG